MYTVNSELLIVYQHHDSDYQSATECHRGGLNSITVGTNIYFEWRQLLIPSIVSTMFSCHNVMSFKVSTTPSEDESTIRALLSANLFSVFDQRDASKRATAVQDGLIRVIFLERGPMRVLILKMGLIWVITRIISVSRPSLPSLAAFAKPPVQETHTSINDKLLWEKVMAG